MALSEEYFQNDFIGKETSERRFSGLHCQIDYSGTAKSIKLFEIGKISKNMFIFIPVLMLFELLLLSSLSFPFLLSSLTQGEYFKLVHYVLRMFSPPKISLVI